MLALGVCLHLFPQQTWVRVRERWATAALPLRAAVYAGLLVAFPGLRQGAPGFIYFQF